MNCAALKILETPSYTSDCSVYTDELVFQPPTKLSTLNSASKEI